MPLEPPVLPWMDPSEPPFVPFAESVSPADEPVFQFLDKKRSEGKPYYVYMTAAGNKFLRRYYGKVMAYFATLENLQPIDMDSTGLQHAE